MWDLTAPRAKLRGTSSLLCWVLYNCFCKTVKIKWVLSCRFSTCLQNRCRIFCTSLSEHFLSSSNPVWWVLSPWRQLTEPRYRTLKSTHNHAHPRTCHRNRGLVQNKQCINDIFVFTSRWQMLTKATDRHPALLMAWQSSYKWITTLHTDFPAYLSTIHTANPDTLASNSIITDMF